MSESRESLLLLQNSLHGVENIRLLALGLRENHPFGIFFSFAVFVVLSVGLEYTYIKRNFMTRQITRSGGEGEE